MSEINENEKLYKDAHSAGLIAGRKIVPTSMVVGEETYPFSGILDDSKPQYYEEDGVCGFAWVTIKPARGKFVSWLKKHKIGGKGTYGGYMLWISEFGQSYERKRAYATAFSSVLREAGINAYSESRLD